MKNFRRASEVTGDLIRGDISFLARRALRRMADKRSRGRNVRPRTSSDYLRNHSSEVRGWRGHVYQLCSLYERNSARESNQIWPQPPEAFPFDWSDAPNHGVLEVGQTSLYAPSKRARWSEGVCNNAQDNYPRGGTGFRDVRFTSVFLSVKPDRAGCIGTYGMRCPG
jgi:hypothetical protein